MLWPHLCWFTLRRQHITGTLLASSLSCLLAYCRSRALRWLFLAVLKLLQLLSLGLLSELLLLPQLLLLQLLLLQL